MHTPHSAYRRTLRTTGPARDRDADELARVTYELLNAKTVDARIDAIDKTRRIWTRCGVNACHDNGSMPEPLRRSMEELASNMVRACDQAAAGDYSSIQALIDVNRDIISGLTPTMNVLPRAGGFHSRVRQSA